MCRIKLTRFLKNNKIKSERMFGISLSMWGVF